MNIKRHWILDVEFHSNYGHLGPSLVKPRNECTAEGYGVDHIVDLESFGQRQNTIRSNFVIWDMKKLAVKAF